ncbi:hypothetical protein B0H13DRAFT_2529422 [Mycena leptocephala]|nr:hypothetical protein B0H13DRAFT_2529422 [Mycena leptocephala]
MPCSGKEGKGCPCPGFQLKRDGATSENPKCKNCKHRERAHSPRTVNDVLADRLAKYDVVDRLRSKPVSDADARRESNTGFRPKEGGRFKKARNSNAKPSEHSVKVGGIHIITGGLNEEKELRETRCPAGQAVEKLRKQGLMVSKDPDGSPLAFSLNWTPTRSDQWIRDMFPSPNVFQYLDLKYGSDADHYVLLAKERQRLFVKQEVASGEDFDDAKGASGRNYKESTVRIATRHKIPAAVIKEGWADAIKRLENGEDVASESEEERKKSSGKAKAQKSRRASPTESEAELSPSDSDSDASRDRAIDPEVKQEPADDFQGIPVRRRSSRLTQEANFDGVKDGVDDEDKSSHASGHESRSLFHHDSDVEEISGLQSDLEDIETYNSRKRPASFLSFDISDSEERKRSRTRSASRGSNYSAIDVDSDHDSHEDGPSPRLGPTTSSFSFDPASTLSPFSTSGPFLSASGSLFGSSKGSTSTASVPLTTGTTPQGSVLPSSAVASSASVPGPSHGGARRSAARPTLASYTPAPRAGLKIPETKYNPYD